MYGNVIGHFSSKVSDWLCVRQHVNRFKSCRAGGLSNKLLNGYCVCRARESRKTVWGKILQMSSNNTNTIQRKMERPEGRHFPGQTNFLIICCRWCSQLQHVAQLKFQFQANILSYLPSLNLNISD